MQAVKQLLKEPTEANYQGTSFHRVTIRTTPSELIELCELTDVEYHESNLGEDKCNFDFEFYNEENDLYFTVYDWKEYSPLYYNESYDFHIGAKDYASSLLAKELLLESLNSL